MRKVYEDIGQSLTHVLFRSQEVTIPKDKTLSILDTGTSLGEFCEL